MSTHSRPQKCLSNEEHENRVRDVKLHYFGCLKVSQRPQFYNRLPEESRRRLHDEENRIEKLRGTLERQPETKAGALLKVFTDSMNDWREVKRQEPFQERRQPDRPHYENNNIDCEIKASMIFFKNSRPYDIPGFQGTFPNQKTPISNMLAEDQDLNPLMQPCEENMVRYFHLPANNMIWVEVRLSPYPICILRVNGSFIGSYGALLP